MRAERLGSYSIAATLAGIASFVRLKSMMRYCLRQPPPLCRTVIWPLLLRPLCFFLTSTRPRSGFLSVSSEKSIVVMKRRPAEVGLYFLTGIYLLLKVVDAVQLDFLPGSNSDDGFFPVRTRTRRANAFAREVLLLAWNRHGVDLKNRHLEDFLNGVLDLRLACKQMHLKAVLLHSGVQHRLLGDQRGNNDVAGVHYFVSGVKRVTIALYASTVMMMRV